MALIDDFNDDYFNEVAHFYTELVKKIADEFSEKPTLEDLITLTTWGLRSLPETALQDMSPGQLESLKPKLKTNKAVRLSEGDLIAIPMGTGMYAFSVYLGKARFGYAYGIFKGVHPLRSIPNETRLEPLFAAYSGRDFVMEGKWPNLGNYPKLRSLFDGLPPIYHSKKNHPENKSVGPFGSSEGVDGALRQITEEEAMAVGLIDGTYRSCRLEEEFEKYVSLKVMGLN